MTSLTPNVLLFAPGTGILYSNFGFDLLAQALANAAGKPYADLLKERVLDPAGLKDTRFDLTEADKSRTMQGHNFDGSPMPVIPTSPMIVGAGGLYSTANDMLRCSVGTSTASSRRTRRCGSLITHPICIATGSIPYTGWTRAG